MQSGSWTWCNTGYYASIWGKELRIITTWHTHTHTHTHSCIIKLIETGIQWLMMMIDVLRPLFCTWQAKWAERPPKVMQLSQRWNTLQICPCRDSNSGGSDLWYNETGIYKQGSATHHTHLYYNNQSHFSSHKDDTHWRDINSDVSLFI